MWLAKLIFDIETTKSDRFVCYARSDSCMANDHLTKGDVGQEAIAVTSPATNP
jgi:hypothetical protein